MNHDERDQQLEAEYRRASEQDAGRPAATTRAAILAEAAAGAAARRRATSAANEPRYWMRAVAGVAVVGFGILLWRQTDHRLPGESVMVVENQQLQEADAPTAVADAAAPAAPAPAAPAPAAEESALQTSPPAASRQAANAGAAAAEEADAPATADLAREQRAAQPAQAPPAVATESQQKAAAPPAADELEEVTVTATAPFAAGVSSEADSLLRQHFPSQYQSDSPHRLWLVRNAAGVVLQMGELAAGESLEDIAARLAGRPGTWRELRATNARGQTIQLSVGEIP
jgi:hypothetical protein